MRLQPRAQLGKLSVLPSPLIINFGLLSELGLSFPLPTPIYGYANGCSTYGLVSDIVFSIVRASTD